MSNKNIETKYKKVRTSSKWVGGEYETKYSYFKRNVTKILNPLKVIKKYVPVPLSVLGALGMVSFGAYEAVKSEKIQTTISVNEDKIENLEKARGTVTNNSLLSGSDATAVFKDDQFKTWTGDIDKLIEKNKTNKLNKITPEALAISMIVIGIVGGIALTSFAYIFSYECVNKRDLYKEKYTEWTETTKSIYEANE